jgi:predicted dehydrogenase
MESAMTQPLRWGMVGGGPGSGIGPAHRRGAQLDGQYALVAGAFSRDPARNRAMGEELGIAPERVYPGFATMARAESLRPDGIECVSIVTANDSHAAASLAFAGAGIDVICDKPMTTSLADALAVERAVAREGVVFALTHNYAAYPMAVEARHRIRSGEIGSIRLVAVEYAMGGRYRLVEAEGDAKMQWRVDPKIAGPSTVLGDIGTHAHHLMRAVTGLEATALRADLGTVVPGRTADDNAYVDFRLANGARAHLWACMAAAGNGQGLRIRVFGDRASLHWEAERPDELHIRGEGVPYFTLRRGEPYLGNDAKRLSRAKPGNPSGHFEAFANLYLDAAAAIRARRAKRALEAWTPAFASARDGVHGMAFIEAAVESSRRGCAWVDLALPPAP